LSFDEFVIGHQDYAWNVATADVDSDGDEDVLAVYYQIGDAPDKEFGLVVLYDNEDDSDDGTFLEIIINDAGNAVRWVEAADFDDDGDVDVVALGSKWIALFDNDGAQSFTEHRQENRFSGARSGNLYDVDRDGNLDTLVAVYADDTIFLYRAAR